MDLPAIDLDTLSLIWALLAFLQVLGKLIQKALTQTLKLCVFDHYSMIPTFHHSM